MSGEETNAARSWWPMLGMLILTNIVGFLLNWPSDTQDADNTFWMLLGGVINMFTVCVIGMGLLQFYLTTREKRMVVARKYVFAVIICVVVKYIYLESMQTALLTTCFPDMILECRKTLEEGGYHPLVIIMGDIFLFLSVGSVGVFLIRCVCDPIDEDNFPCVMVRFAKLQDDDLSDVEIKSQGATIMDNDIAITKTI